MKPPGRPPRRRLEVLFLIATGAVAILTLSLSSYTNVSASSSWTTGLARRFSRIRTAGASKGVMSPADGTAPAVQLATPLDRRTAGDAEASRGDPKILESGAGATVASKPVLPTPSPRPTEMSPATASEALADLLGARTPNVADQGKSRQAFRRRRLPPRLPDPEAALAACEAWGAAEAAREARVSAARSTAARRVAAERVAARRRAAAAASKQGDIKGGAEAEEVDEGLAAKRAVASSSWHEAMQDMLLLGGDALHRRPRGHVTHAGSSKDAVGLKAAEEAAEDVEAAAGEEGMRQERERLMRLTGQPPLIAAREALAADRARVEAAAWRAAIAQDSNSRSTSNSGSSRTVLPGGRNAVSAFVDGVEEADDAQQAPLLLEDDDGGNGGGKCGCPLLSDIPYPGWSFDCGEWDARILADLAPWWAADNNKDAGNDSASGVHAEGAPPVTSELLLHAWRTPMNPARSSLRPSLLLSVDNLGRLRARARNIGALAYDDALLSMLHTLSASVALPRNTSLVLSAWEVPSTPRDDPLPVFHITRSVASLGGIFPYPFRWDFGRGDFDIQPLPLEHKARAKEGELEGKDEGAGAGDRERGPPAHDALSRVRAYQHADAQALAATAADGAPQTDEASEVEAAMQLLMPPQPPSSKSSSEAPAQVAAGVPLSRPRTIADEVCPPWAERPEHRVTWRGECMGPSRGYSRQAYHLYLRSRAGAASRAHPLLLDLGLASDCTYAAAAKAQVAERRKRIGAVNSAAESNDAAPPSPFPTVPRLPLEREDMCRYREMLHVDGNSVSARISGQLASGTLLYKPDSVFSEWFYHLLRPWIHYVPVRERLEDLHETVLFMRSQPRLSACIAGNAAVFARRYLNRATAACYIWRLLSAWRSLHAPPEGIVATEDDLAAAAAAIARGQHYIDGEDDVIED